MRKKGRKCAKIIAISILCCAICGIVSLVAMIIYRFTAPRSFYIYQQDGNWYFQWKNPPERPSYLDYVNVSWRSHIQDWNTIDSFQDSMFAGTVDERTESSFKTDIEYGHQGGTYRFCDIHQLDNIVMPVELDSITLTNLLWLTPTLKFHNEDIGVNEGKLYLYGDMSCADKDIEKFYNQEPCTPIYDQKLDAKIYTLDYGNGIIRKEIRYTIEDGSHEYYITEHFTDADDVVPYRIDGWYLNRTYDCIFYLNLDTQGNDSKPEKEWISAFRYEPD